MNKQRRLLRALTSSRATRSDPRRFVTESSRRSSSSAIVATRTPSATSSLRSRAAAGLASHRNIRRYIQAAITATATNRLHQQSCRRIARGQNIALRDVGHIGRITATCARATQTNSRRNRTLATTGQSRGDVKATVAATAADRLGNRPRRIVTARLDVIGHGQANNPAVAATGTRSTQTNTNSRSTRATTSQGGRDVKSAITTAAANRLRKHSRRLILQRQNSCIHSRINTRTIAAASTLTAQADANTCRTRAASRQSCGDVKATIAATAADGLCNKTRRRNAVRENPTIRGCINVARLTTASTIAAKTHTNRSRTSSRSAKIGRHVKSSSTTTAANRLRHNTRRTVALGHHRFITAQSDLCRICRNATFAAKTNTHSHSARACTRKRRRDVKATAAARTANRLRQNTGCRVTTRGHCARYNRVDSVTITRATTLTAQTNTDGRRTRASARRIGGHIEPAVTTTATKRLRNKSRRTKALCVNRTIRFCNDRTRLAATSTRPAKAHTNRTRTRACRRQTGRYVKTTVTAAAANRLGHNARGIVVACGHCLINAQIHGTSRRRRAAFAAQTNSNATRSRASTR